MLEVAPCLTIRGWSILSICKRLPGSRRRSRFQPRTHTSACPITRIGRDAAQSNGLSRPPYLLRPRFGPSHSHVENVKRVWQRQAWLLDSLAVSTARKKSECCPSQNRPNRRRTLYRAGGPRVPTCAWPCVQPKSGRRSKAPEQLGVGAETSIPCRTKSHQPL